MSDIKPDPVSEIDIKESSLFELVATKEEEQQEMPTADDLLNIVIKTEPQFAGFEKIVEKSQSRTERKCDTLGKLAVPVLKINELLNVKLESNDNESNNVHHVDTTHVDIIEAHDSVAIGSINQSVLKTERDEIPCRNFSVKVLITRNEREICDAYDRINETSQIIKFLKPKIIVQQLRSELVETCKEEPSFLHECGTLLSRNKSGKQSIFNNRITNYCAEKVNRPISLIVQVKKKKKYTCERCKKEYQKLADLKIHLRGHTGERPYQCNQCKKSFSALSGLRRHENIHLEEKPYKCWQCPKSFIELSKLRRHEKIHPGEKTFTCGCNECGMVFDRAIDLHIHRKTHTLQQLQHIHTCAQCHKTFKKADYLKCHIRTHTGEKPFTCKICHKPFSSSSDLGRHRRIHTGDKPYPCDYCQKSYRQWSHLKSHKTIHTGEKPHVCEHCKKSYSQASHLKIHKLIHTGEKPYSCEQCEKSFSRANELKIHKTVHTGEKPYSCEQCKKSFSRANLLITHKIIHTDETT